MRSENHFKLFLFSISLFLIIIHNPQGPFHYFLSATLFKNSKMANYFEFGNKITKIFQLKALYLKIVINNA